MVNEQLMRRSVGWRAVCVAVFAFAVMAVPGCGKSGEASDGSANTSKQQDKDPKTQAVEINGHTFKLELALDDDQREQGLSDRKEIAKDGGMLFVFSQPRRAAFVMRRCFVPIDLIYLDDEGYIDSIHRMAVIEPIGGSQWKNPSRGYASAGFVQFAIELKGDTLDKLDLRRGDKIELPYKKLESMAQ